MRTTLGRRSANGVGSRGRFTERLAVNDYGVALLVFAPLVVVWGVVSAGRLQAKPPSDGWVVSGYAVLAVILVEALWFVWPLITTLDADPVFLGASALVYLPVLLPAGYAIAAQRWGRGDHSLMLQAAFTFVLIVFALSAIYQAFVMR